MSQFFNDVRLVPLLASNTSTGTPDTPTPKPGESEGAETGGQKSVSVHVTKHSDNDGIFAAIPITAIVFTFVYLIIKAIMAPFTNRNRHTLPAATGGGLTEEEVAVLQKLQRTLAQMESRVEALETILIDQARTEKNYGSKL